jgi:hypothetical protein
LTLAGTPPDEVYEPKDEEKDKARGHAPRLVLCNLVKEALSDYNDNRELEKMRKGIRNE